MVNWDNFLARGEKNTVLNHLLQIPEKDSKKTAPKFPLLEKNAIHQADLLSMPNDNGYKYILTVVDIGTRRCDAEPLKTKTAEAVKDAFITIYARDILELPKRLEVDDGSEFKGETLAYMKRHRVWVRVAKPGRHRQQGLVERYNQILGSLLFKRMTAQELLTGQQSNEWVEDLPSLVVFVNKRADKRVAKMKKNIDENVIPDPVEEKDTNILPIGEDVRVKLDNPIDVVSGERLHGKFRSTDIRFHPEVREIKQVVIKPASPVLYLLNDPKKKERKFEPVGYARNQLQVVKKDEKHYNGRDVVRGEPETFIIDELVGKRKIRNRIYYKVRWVGYPNPADHTYEPRTQLLQDVPDLVTEYERTHH